MKSIAGRMITAPRSLSVACGAFTIVSLFSAPAFAQCNSTWNVISGNWGTASNWNPNTAYPDSPTTNVCLTNGIIGTPATTTLDVSPTAIANLTVGAYNTLNANSGTALYLNGNISNSGAINLSNQLRLTNDVTLSGSGTLTLISTDGETGQIGTDSNSRTLTNESTIAGSGLIGSNASSVYPNVSLNNSGTVNANSSGNTLTIGGSGTSITNTGLFEATGGGILTLSSNAAIANNGGNITATGTGSTVNLTTTIQGGTLNTSLGGILQTSGSATLDASANAITLTNGSTYTAGVGTTTSVTGTLNLGTGSTLALGGQLRLTGDTTLSGTGTLVMTSVDGETGQIGTDSNSRTLNNEITITGSGLIGSNASSVYPNLSLNNSGTVNANSSGNTLTIGGSGTSITNTSLFEATNGGILTLATSTPVNNVGGNITATGAGSTVNVSTTIQGGTLNTSLGGTMQTSGSATLDASANAITLTNGSTYTAGAGTTTSVTGTLNLGTGSTLALGGQLRLTGDTTLSGTGTLVMTSVDGETGQIGTDSNSRTLNNEITITGSGLIGSNASSVYPNLSLNNSGTVNANSSGNTLMIGGSGTSITNTGLFEATNGGILTLATSTPVNNVGGNITATGAGSTVNVSTTIQGGTLNTSLGGFLQTAGFATLDGSTNAITLSNGSTYTSGSGALTSVTGQLNLGTGGDGSNVALGGQLRLVGDTTLSGPGSLTMTGNPNDPSGATGAQIGTNSNGFTLTNNVIIQGSGLIGSNVGSLYQNLNLTNNATINANTSGNTLEIAGTGTITNSGAFEATAGGILTLAASNPINNNGGTISASGAGSTVNVQNTTIQGGTLTTSGGGVMQTIGTSVLDASTRSAITLTNGSTYTSGSGAFTEITGQLNLGTSGSGSNFALGGPLQLVGNTTLSGPGSLTMTGNPSDPANPTGAQIGTNSNGYTLTNNARIQGSGLIGSNIGALYQNLNLTNGGIVSASGGTLQIGGTGLMTNTATGTLEAQSGATLHISAALSTSDFSAGVLSNGSYEALNGTVQIDSLGSTGGEITTNQNANIVLSGPNGKIVDSLNLNALSNFQDNMAAGSFTVENSNQFTTIASVTNEGAVDVGSGTTTSFTTDGNYTQSGTGSTTQVDGTLTALGGEININDGTLSGLGTAVASTVTIDTNGALSPGDPGDFSIIGNLLLNGTYDEQIAGTGAGQFDEVLISGLLAGTANIGSNSTLDISLDGFNPGANSHDSFVILDATGGRIGEFTNVDFTNLGSGETYSLDYSNPDEVILDLNGAVTTATPEPGFYIPVLFGIAIMIGFKVRARRQGSAPQSV